MKDLILKIKNSVKIFGKRGNVYQRDGINPARDWGFMLVTASVLVVVFGAYSYYLYREIDSGVFVEAISSVNGAETHLNASLLDQVSTDLDSRAREFERLKDISLPVDPSI